VRSSKSEQILGTIGRFQALAFRQEVLEWHPMSLGWKQPPWVASDGVLASLGEPPVHPWVADRGVQEPRDDADHAFTAVAWGLLLGLQGLDDQAPDRIDLELVAGADPAVEGQLVDAELGGQRSC